MSQEKLLVDQIKDEIRGIIESEIRKVSMHAEVIKEAPESARKRVESLMASYRKLDETILRLHGLSVLSLPFSLAKSADFVLDKDNAYGTWEVQGTNMRRIRVQVGQANPKFSDEYVGDEFVLEFGKRYRLLVAFIPEEAEKK